MSREGLEATTIAKVTWRLIPFLLLLYIVAWLDRVNVGFAALQMNEDLGFSAAVYGFGAGVFFIGYALCEIPSNLILARVGARRWIARIMVTWGVLAVAMMWVHSPTSFYVLRFLLGVAEAGFLPGIIYYLSNWYPAAAARARGVDVHDRHSAVDRRRRPRGGTAARDERPVGARAVGSGCFCSRARPAVVLGVSSCGAICLTAQRRRAG